MVCGLVSAIPFLPSTLIPLRRFLSLALRSLATSMAFSNALMAPRICRIRRAVGVSSRKAEGLLAVSRMIALVPFASSASRSRLYPWQLQFRAQAAGGCTAEREAAAIERGKVDHDR